MKKTIAILLILVIGMVGVFAADEATVYIKTIVPEFMHIGLTDYETTTIESTAFDSEQDFLDSGIKSSVIYEYDDDGVFATLSSFISETVIAHVWGITNSFSAITVDISTPGFVGENEYIIPLTLNGEEGATSMTISAATNSAIGKLNGTALKIVEASSGTIAVAPAQEYEATITISITTDGSGGEGGED